MTVRRVMGISWALGVPIVLVFALLLAPPATGVAAVGYGVWLAMVTVGVAGTIGPRWQLGLGVMLAITSVELAALVALQAETGGWKAPFYQVIGIHAVIVAACFPARFSVPFVITAALATFTPLLSGETTGRVGDVALYTGTWFGLCSVGLIAMRRIRERRAELSLSATTDELTGLGNRRALADRFARTGGGLIGLADVDKFKAINDRLGHLAGDACLRDVGSALSRAVGDQSLCYRWAGDEFVVLLPVADETLARRRIAVDEAASSVRIGSGDGIGVTVGWAGWEAGADLDTVLRDADADLLKNKYGSPVHQGTLRIPSIRRTPRVADS